MVCCHFPQKIREKKIFEERKKKNVKTTTMTAAALYSSSCSLNKKELWKQALTGKEGEKLGDIDFEENK